jgi:hypothetical protein
MEILVIDAFKDSTEMLQENAFLIVEADSDTITQEESVKNVMKPIVHPVKIMQPNVLIAKITGT